MHAGRLENILFRYGMWWRIFYGALRILLGLALFKVVNVPFTDVLYAVMGQELVEDPSDFIFHSANSFLHAHTFVVTHFIIFHLLFWGVIDIVLSAALLRRNRWAFPVSLYLVGIFNLYEVYRYFHTHSLILLSVIFIDLCIMWLIWREYVKEKAR